MNTVKTVLIAAVLSAGLFSAMQGFDLNFGMEVRNRFTLVQEAPDDTGDAEITQTYFSIDRGYVILSAKYNDYLSGKLTVDFLSSKDYKDGASVRLKTGYIQLSNLVQYHKFQLGLIGNVFGEEGVAKANCPTISSRFFDMQKLHSSADYGTAAIGNLEYFDWAATAVNGEGYKNTCGSANFNKKMMFAVAANIKPLPILNFGGSYVYDNPGTPDADDEYASNNIYHAAINFNHEYFGLGAVYYGRSFTAAGADDAVKSMGFAVYPVLHLKPMTGNEIDIYARYDQWDPDTDTDDDGLNRIFGGFNWTAFKDSKNCVYLGAEYMMESYEMEDYTSTNMFLFQVKWVFDTKVSS
ncbi:hypothetical protein JXL83_10135 [candidate division WOR-3 bacterium]|nr:hypothetical protein [candidate division WOR-3 bacterium]